MSDAKAPKMFNDFISKVTQQLENEAKKATNAFQKKIDASNDKTKELKKQNDMLIVERDRLKKENEKLLRGFRLALKERQQCKRELVKLAQLQVTIGNLKSSFDNIVIDNYENRYLEPKKTTTTTTTTSKPVFTPNKKQRLTPMELTPVPPRVAAKTQAPSPGLGGMVNFDDLDSFQETMDALSSSTVSSPVKPQAQPRIKVPDKRVLLKTVNSSVTKADFHELAPFKDLLKLANDHLLVKQFEFVRM